MEEENDIEKEIEDIINGVEPEERMSNAELRRNVQDNDVLLLELALYKATKGQTVLLNDMELIQSAFTELKTLVQRGSFTMEELERDIYQRYGVVQACPREVEMSSVLKDLLGHAGGGKPQIGF